MRNRIITALLAVALLGFAALGIANITKTHNKLKTKDIQLQSKQSDLQLLEIKFNKLNIDLQKELGSKTQDQTKIDKLEQEKKDLQKSLEDAQEQVRVKAEQKVAEAKKLQQAASLSAPVYAASSGSVESIIRQAAAKYGVSGDMLVRIARCESGLNPGSVATNFIAGTHPTGLFQHVAAYWPQRAINYGYPGANIFDATAQANVTAQMFRDGLQGLWECK